MAIDWNVTGDDLRKGGKYADTPYAYQGAGNIDLNSFPQLREALAKMQDRRNDRFATDETGTTYGINAPRGSAITVNGQALPYSDALFHSLRGPNAGTAIDNAVGANQQFQFPDFNSMFGSQGGGSNMGLMDQMGSMGVRLEDRMAPPAYSADNFNFQLPNFASLFPAQGAPSGTAGFPSGGSAGTSPLSLSSVYQPGAPVGDQYFNELLQKIGAPSSVDEVQKNIESDALKQTLGQIDRDTAQSISGVHQDALDRGIGGPGQESDIESNAVAQAAASGGRTKAAARTAGLQAELERQKAREGAVNTAYGARYGAGVNQDTQSRDIMSKLIPAVMNYNLTASEGAAGRASQAGLQANALGSAEKMSYFDNLIKTLMQGKDLSQQNTQYYAGLDANAEQNALGRTADYNRALLSRQPEMSSWDKFLNTALLAGQVGMAYGGHGTTGGLFGAR